MTDPLIAIIGPTASAKSAWALDLAEIFNGEIVGADSRQIYRGLDIGTAKPSAQDRARVPHHCIDHVDPSQRYHLARFLADATAAIADIRSRGRRPLLVGGTGQYVWALLEGWDVPPVPPDTDFRAALEARALDEGAAVLHAELALIDARAAQRIPSTNVRRVIRALEVHHLTGRPISSWHDARNPVSAVIVAPQVDRDVLDQRIDARVERMFADGLVEETRALIDAGLPRDAPGLESVGYREVVQHLGAELTLADAIAATQQATRRLARRQWTWFGLDDDRIHWRADVAEARTVIDSV